MGALRGSRARRSRACASSTTAAGCCGRRRCCSRPTSLGLASFGANIANAALNAALARARRARHPRLRWRADIGRDQGRARRDATCASQLAEGGSAAAPRSPSPPTAATPSRARPRALPRAPGTIGRPPSPPASATRARTPASRTELHRRAGPLTTVPLPGDASSLVWVEDPHEAAPPRCASTSTHSWPSWSTRLQGLLGALSDVGPARACYPLAGLAAERMGQNRVALVGEAAHVMPPIGAQGLNLGLRDAAALAECVGRRAVRGARTSAARDARRPIMPRAPADVLAPHGLGRSAQPLAADRIFCPCRPCAASGCICSPTSRRCAACSCAAAWRARAPAAPDAAPGALSPEPLTRGAGAGQVGVRSRAQADGGTDARMPSLKDLRYRVEYAALRLIAALVRAVPLDVGVNVSAKVWRLIAPLRPPPPARARQPRHRLSRQDARRSARRSRSPCGRTSAA